MPKEMSAAELAGRIGLEGEPLVIDVRKPEEHAGGSIPGATNLPLADLADQLDPSRETVSWSSIVAEVAGRVWAPTSSSRPAST